MQNAPFRNLRLSGQSPCQTQISILEIFNIFLPAPWNAKPIPLGWLKLSPSLILTKIEHFSKVSERRKICRDNKDIRSEDRSQISEVGGQKTGSGCEMKRKIAVLCLILFMVEGRSVSINNWQNNLGQNN